MSAHSQAVVDVSYGVFMLSLEVTHSCERAVMNSDCMWHAGFQNLTVYLFEMFSKFAVSESQYCC